MIENEKIELEQKEFNEKELFKDFQDELEEIRQEEILKMFKALDYMKGHEVVADTMNSFMTYKPYEEFNYSLSNNVKGDLLLNLKDIDNKSESISFKLDDIQEIEVDDNSEWVENGQIDKYECEKIIITLWNDSKLMLEYQW